MLISHINRAAVQNVRRHTMILTIPLKTGGHLNAKVPHPLRTSLVSDVSLLILENCKLQLTKKNTAA